MNLELITNEQVVFGILAFILLFLFLSKRASDDFINEQKKKNSR